jgi:predicted amidohydrolase
VSARARALENQCYTAVSFMIGSVALSEPIENTTGQSAVFGPIDTLFSGEGDGIIASAPKDETAMIFAEISKEKIDTVRQDGEIRLYQDFYNHDYFRQNPVIISSIVKL